MNSKVVPYNDEDVEKPQSGERTLCAAILERAWRDIHPGENVEAKDIREAITWFLLPEPLSQDSRFTFHNIVEYLQLLPGEVTFMKEAAQAAQEREDAKNKAARESETFKKKIDQPKAKREESRVGVGSSFTELWNHICQTHRSVQREIRAFRCSRGRVAFVPYRE